MYLQTFITNLVFKDLTNKSAELVISTGLVPKVRRLETIQIAVCTYVHKYINVYSDYLIDSNIDFRVVEGIWTDEYSVSETFKECLTNSTILYRTYIRAKGLGDRPLAHYCLLHHRRLKQQLPKVEVFKQYY